MSGINIIRHMILEAKREKEIQNKIYRKYLKMKSDENRKSYLEGYRDAISLNKDYPMTAMFMGYNLDQLSEIVRKYEQAEISKDKETKMTREEAIKKLAAVSPYIDGEAIVNCIEALGLIKFDEPEKLSPTEIFKKIYNEYKSGLTAEAFIKRLNYEGVYIEDLNPK